MLNKEHPLYPNFDFKHHSLDELKDLLLGDYKKIHYDTPMRETFMALVEIIKEVKKEVDSLKKN